MQQRSRVELNSIQNEADNLYRRYVQRDPAALNEFRTRHPRFLDEKIPWLSKNSPDDEIVAAALTSEDAQLAVARRYDFRDWPAVLAYFESLNDPATRR